MTNDDKIDLYLTGQLSAPEKDLFELEMAKNPELAQEVAFQRELIQAIQAKGAKEYLQKVEQNIQLRQKRTHLFKIYIPTIAVAACLLIGVFFQFNLNQTSRALGYGIKFDMETSRGNDGLENVTALIESKDFETALTFIRQERQTTPDFDLNTEEGQYLHHQHNIYIADLNWYEAIAYLRAGKYWKAKKCLKQIVSENGYYSAQAQEILNQM